MTGGPTTHKNTLWKQSFPELAQSTEPAIQRVIEQTKLIELPGQLQVSHVGKPCSDYLLVANGSIRIQLLTRTGREIILYHVNPGEGCVLTTSCLLSKETFPAEAFTEEATQILVLSTIEFNRAVGESLLFRQFVFNNFGQRLASVINRIEQLSAPSIDISLASTLLKLSNDYNTQTISATHQELASALGTAREVVSRHLKRLEEKGLVSLGRGTIQINEPDILARTINNKPHRASKKHVG